jgi:ABC-2 type transport system permease protein
MVIAAALTALTFIAIGVALGSSLPSARSAQGLGLLLFLPMFLLGGGGPPPEAMTPTMDAIAQWLPLTHAIRAVQEPWLDLSERGSHLWPLGIYLLAATVAAIAASRLGRAWWTERARSRSPPRVD